MRTTRFIGTRIASSAAAVVLLSGLACAPGAVADPTQSAAPTALQSSAADVASLPHIVAHRGGRKWAPENTLSSFRKSLEHGVYAVELDIHKCKTGELIVIHDEDVKRTTNGEGLVKDKTLAELKALDAGKWYAPEFAGEHLPLLSEVLDLVQGKAVIYIEIKNCPIRYPGIEEDLAKMLSTYKYPDKILVISFDHQALHHFHEIAPQYKVSFLDACIPVDIGKYSQLVGATAWNPEFSLIRPDSVTEAHKAGIEVNPWTVNKEDDWRSAVSMGVDGITTDDPQGLATFLQQYRKATR